MVLTSGEHLDSVLNVIHHYFLYLHPDPRWPPPQHGRRQAASGARTAADRRDVSATLDWTLDRTLDQTLDRTLDRTLDLFWTWTEDRDQKRLPIGCNIMWH